MRYCPHCATALEERIPNGDDRPRKTCPACGAIHYRNPLSVVGCIVERGSEVLLCRRAIEPALGRWTLPAGFLELGEGSAEGARRETREEACAEVEVTALHSCLDVPLLGQVYSLFRARLLTPEFSPGVESLEVAFFDVHSVPWDELAFPVIEFALRLFIEDQRTGNANVHSGLLRFRGGGSGFDSGNYVLEDHLKQRLR